MSEINEQNLKDVSGGGESGDLAQLFEELYQKILDTDCITCTSIRRSKCRPVLKKWLVEQVKLGNTDGLHCPQK